LNRKNSPSKNWKPERKIFGGFFDIDAKERQIKTLEEKTTAENFWSDNDAAQKILKEIAQLKSWTDAYAKIEKKVTGEKETIEIAAELADESALGEITKDLAEIEKAIAEVEFRNMLSGPDDARNCIITIHAGAGGTEAQDWADMLYRMYMRWGERKGFKLATVDYQEGDTAGVKTATLEVRGDYAYGMLKAENGVHRLVRISPYDANARRHTSFASVFAYPEAPPEVEIEIKSDDLKIDTYRSGGKGGQNVNKVETAVRITHIPSGVIVACQEERSQFQNKERAMKMLKSRLYQIRRDEEDARKRELEGKKRKIEWGSQIRSYVLDDRRVKDHRTNVENFNPEAVLDGELDDFIEKYLMQFGND
jgi:peptide chain release factor 2